MPNSYATDHNERAQHPAMPDDTFLTAEAVGALLPWLRGRTPAQVRGGVRYAARQGLIPAAAVAGVGGRPSVWLAKDIKAWIAGLSTTVAPASPASVAPADEPAATAHVQPQQAPRRGRKRRPLPERALALLQGSEA